MIYNLWYNMLTTLRCNEMMENKKKILLSCVAVLVLVVAIVFLFKSNRICSMFTKELPFSTVVNKEYIYVGNDMENTMLPSDAEGENINITFSNDGVFGFGGVNRYFAGYKLTDDGKTIEFSPIGSTMMAGPEDRMKMESQYFATLNKVNRVKVYKTKLVLITPDGDELIFVENNLPSDAMNNEAQEQPQESQAMVDGEEMHGVAIPSNN